MGPGKYDHVCSATREALQADGVLLIVLKGNRGDGFSLTAYEDTAVQLPALLRHVADQIEADLANKH